MDVTAGMEMGLVDVVAGEGESVVEAAARYLGAYVSVGGERSAVEAVRGMKRIVANVTRMGTATDEEIENAQQFEREVFGRCWGSEENLKAVNKPREPREKKH